MDKKVKQVEEAKAERVEKAPAKNDAKALVGFGHAHEKDPSRFSFFLLYRQFYNFLDAV